MSAPAPEFNLSRIDFPSDRVTLKQLRERGVSFGDEDTGESLDIMHIREQKFAALGFAVGLGDADRIATATAAITCWTEVDGPYDEVAVMREERELLAGDYVRFGAAEGLESARQLVRRLEDQGTEQGRRLAGPGRI